MGMKQMLFMEINRILLSLVKSELYVVLQLDSQLYHVHTKNMCYMLIETIHEVFKDQKIWKNS